MTVASETSRVSYAGNDSTTIFSVPFYFLNNSDLKVYLRVNATGVETLQTITTHYSVTGAGVLAGGSVTMVTPPATGQTLVIYRDPSLTQQTDYVGNDPFPAETHERALDKLTMLVQRLSNRFSRALALKETSSYSGLTIPDPETGKLLRWKSDLTGLENATGTQLGALIEATQAQAEAGTEQFIFLSPLRGKQAIQNGTFFSQNGTGASNRTFAAKMRETISPEDFGAVGNGVVDDTTALQNMANQACRYGGYVIFPRYAKYKITSTIVWKPQVPEGNDAAGGVYNPSSNILFNLDKRSVHIDMNHARIIAGAAMTNMFHFVFDNTAGINEVAPFFSMVERGVFEGAGLATRGIYCEWCLGAQIYRNRIYGVTTGIKFTGYGTQVVKYNHIRAETCFDLSDGGADNLYEHNDLYPTGTTCRAFKMTQATGGQLRIISNAATGENPAQTAYFIEVDATASSAILRDVVALANGVAGMNQLIYARGNPSSFNLKYWVVEGNNALDYDSKVTLGLVDTTETDGWSVKDNKFHPASSTSKAILMTNDARSIIEKNYLRGCSNTAIHLAFGNRTTIEGNKLYNVGSSVNTKAIRLTNGSSGCRIDYNTIDQDAGGGTYAAIGTAEEDTSNNNRGTGNITRNVPTKYVSLGSASRLGEPVWLQCTTQASVAAASTVYLGQTGANATEVLVHWVAPFAGRVIALKAGSVAAPGAGQTFTYTARIASVDQSMTAQISGGASFSASDTINHFAVAEGDLLSIKLVTSGTAAATGHRVSLLFMAD